MEPVIGFEPMASSLPRMCSTPELHRRMWWARLDSNQGRHSQRVYSPSPLATRAHAHIARKTVYALFKMRAELRQTRTQRTHMLRRKTKNVNEKSLNPRTRAYLLLLATANGLRFCCVSPPIGHFAAPAGAGAMNRALTPGAAATHGASQCLQAPAAPPNARR